MTRKVPGMDVWTLWTSVQCGGPSSFIIQPSTLYFSSFRLHPFKKAPGNLVVFLAVGEGEGGFVAALDLAGAAGEGVVGDGGGGHGAFGELAGVIFTRKRVEGRLLLLGFMVLGAFEVDRGFIAEGRVQPVSSIETLDVVQTYGLCLCSGFW